MGGRKKSTIGHRYYLGMHAVFCHGPVDRILRIRFDGRDAWVGDRTGGRITIDQEGLFGGERREGGVSGDLDFLPGGPNQGQNSYLRSRLGDLVPAFRGVASIVLRRMYLGMSPYLKPLEATLQRIHTRYDGLLQWNDGRAEIPIDTPLRRPQSIVFVIDRSGSMGNPPPTGMTLDQFPSRLSVVQAGVVQALDRLLRLSKDSKQPVHLCIASFASSYSTAVAQPLSDSNIQHLKDYVLGLEAAGGTDFVAAFTPVVNWFNPSIRDGRERHVVFLTDGVPEPASTFEPALAMMSDILDPTGGQFSYANGTDVRCRAFNLYNEVTFYTRHFHNQPGDVPVLWPGDAEEIADVFYFATMGANSAMNPAHIVRECLTDPDWGLGHPEADIDDASFEAAAEQLFREKFGLCILWDRQMPLEDWVRDVLMRHIDGVTYRDPETGLWKLRLIRDDYDPDELLHLNESNARVEEFSRPALGELTNSVTVNYWDVRTDKQASLTVQDIALAQIQGAEINTTIQYPGIPTAELASRVAQRDLRALSTPLISCTVYAGVEAAQLRAGDVFRLSWADYGVHEVVMRVMQIDYGDGLRNAVRIRAVQDVFGLPAEAVRAEPPTEWEDPVGPPTPAERRAVMEAPYYELLRRLGATTLATLLAENPAAGELLAAAGRPGSALNAQLAVDAGAGYSDTSGELEFCPSAELAADIGPLDTEIPIADGTDLDDIELGTLALIGEECVRVDAVGEDTVTVGRGVLDTPPMPHPAGTVMLFVADDGAGDGEEYVFSDEVAVRIRPVTGAGVLPLVAAPEDVAEFDQRAVRPYPPARLRVNDEAAPETSIAPLVLTWAHRDRLLQADTLVDTEQSSIGPEPGTTYSARLLRADTLDELDAVSGVSGTSATLDSPYTGEVILELWSERDGLESWRRHRLQLTLLNPVDPPTDLAAYGGLAAPTGTAGASV